MRPAPQIIALGWLALAFAAGDAAASDAGAAPSPAFSAAELGFEYHPPQTLPRPQPPFIQPGIFVLPKLIVRDRRLMPDDDALYTGKGLVDFAKKTYLSPVYQKTFGPLAQIATYYLDFPSILMGWHPNDAEALVLYRQEKRLKDLAEVDTLINLELIDDPKQASEFRSIRYDLSESSR